nr:12706_t:CDS:10 [Entrophospora candida]
MVKSKGSRSLLTSQLGLKESKEAQENEIEALKAIFMDDYEPIVVATAWKVAPAGHQFRLHLWPQEEKLKQHVKVDLHVKFPKTYPRSAPDMKIENVHGLSNLQLQQLQSHVSRLIKENLGQEMVFTIAEFIKDYITANNSGIKNIGHHKNQPSFHEQMLNRIEQTTKAELEKSMEEVNRVRQIQEREQQMQDLSLLQKIDEVTQLQKAKIEEERQKRKLMKINEDENLNPTNNSFAGFRTINFENFVRLDDSQSMPFKSVVLGPSIGKGSISSISLVQASNFQIKNLELSSSYVLVLKEIEITEPHYLDLDGKKKLEEIEKDLERIKKLRHPNIISIYESELERVASGWKLHILMEYARGGSLVDLLKKCGVVRLSIAKEYIKQLLNALDFIHANSFVHKDIKASNILLAEISGTDDFIAKLTDVNYHRKLLGDMHKVYPLSKSLNTEYKKNWISPEHETKSDVYSRKNDIWYLGVVFLQMLFGLNVVDDSESLDDVFETSGRDLPSTVRDILQKMLEEDQRKRPTPLELLNDPFFNEGSDTFYDQPLKFLMSSGHSNPAKSLIQNISNKETNDIVGSFGGFGEVVKAQNKLDGRSFILFELPLIFRLNPNDIEKTRKILREVTTLSRLHHEYVVRYFTTWFEDSDGSMKETETFSEEVSAGDDETSDSDDNLVFAADDDEYDFLSTDASNSRGGGYNKARMKESSSSETDSEFEIQDGDVRNVRFAVKSRTAPKKTPTTNNAMYDPGSFRNPGVDRIGSGEDSMTRDIGTTLYVAPEVANNAVIGSRYNQKVDIYSLGIILFEICYKFSTEMERRVTIINIRKPQIIFPKDFLKDKMVNQYHIIQWCLQHNPKDRPTSMELLKSEWMPAKIEDENMQEYVPNPNTPYYRKLISSLFSQSSDKYKDYTYDNDSGNPPFDRLNVLTFGRVHDHLMKIFRHHGAVELSTPLLIPKSDLYEEEKKVVYLLNADGALVQLPYDLTVPFARYVSRNNITDLKRYTFDRAYRENTVGGQPRLVNEVDFDIVHSTLAPMVAEAEIIKIIDEIIEEFPPLKSESYCFYINHFNILDTIFDCCRIPEDIRRGVCGLLGQLDRKHSMNHIRKQLMSLYSLSRSVADELALFDIKGDLGCVSEQLEKLIPATTMHNRIYDVFNEFRLLLSYVKSLGVNLIFQAVKDTDRKDVLAAGGRYDYLIQQFKRPVITNNPSRSRQNTYAVGVNIALQKIVIALETYQSTLCKTIQSKKAEEDKSLGYWALKKCDVYVASFGKILIHERLELVRELWAHNIKTDFMYEEPEDLTPEILASSCKNQGINWIVILKQKNQDNYKATSFRDAITTVKVKNLLWKTEDEVPRNEVCMKLSSEIQEQMRIDHQTSGSKYHKHNSISINESTLHEFSNTNLSISPETSNQQSNFNINIVGVSTPSKPSKKMKLKQKQLLIDKAHDNVSNFLSNINNGNIPVISIDVSRDLLRKFIDCNVLEDESFKSKILDIVPAHQKEYIITVQDALKKQRYQENSNQVWLYSHRDDFGLLYQYFS